MALNVEIERKFLVLRKPDKKPDQVHQIRQGYIARENGNTVRIREKNGRYILCIKTQRVTGGRHELEYEVTKQEGDMLFASIAHAPVVKTREVYQIGELLWEVDIFEGANKGLMIAEVELKSADQLIDIPNWVGPEVTGLSKYYNANIANLPFDQWHIRYDALIERMSD